MLLHYVYFGMVQTVHTYVLCKLFETYARFIHLDTERGVCMLKGWSSAHLAVEVDHKYRSCSILPLPSLPSLPVSPLPFAPFPSLSLSSLPFPSPPLHSLLFPPLLSLLPRMSLLPLAILSVTGGLTHMLSCPTHMRPLAALAGTTRQWLSAATRSCTLLARYTYIQYNALTPSPPLTITFWFASFMI